LYHRYLLKEIVMAEKNESGQDQYALITSATSGIGYKLAKLFAKDGFNLVLCCPGQRPAGASD
jgi:NAD(P)-dependent dehydrogenase (short-subunit alcohol dehydrogenase family)